MRNRLMYRLHRPILAGLLALLVPAYAEAAPLPPVRPNLNAVGTSQILLPATVTKLNDMDFGYVTVTTAGTATVDSSTNVVTTTGGVLFAGGMPHAAQFEAVTPTTHVAHIRLPRQEAVLTRIGGTETMTLDTWTINGATTRNVTAHQTFQFAVGGTIHLVANQVEGTYRGTFDVTVDFN
jgi:Domain of unknown function (DUF4402)